MPTTHTPESVLSPNALERAKKLGRKRKITAQERIEGAFIVMGLPSDKRNPDEQASVLGRPTLDSATQRRIYEDVLAARQRGETVDPQELAKREGFSTITARKYIRHFSAILAVAKV